MHAVGTNNGRSNCRRRGHGVQEVRLFKTARQYPAFFHRKRAPRGPLRHVPTCATMLESTSKAVFLSHASQDSDAAKRISDGLRAHGVEVWFDADGGLEHGDEWDAKIRRQVKECLLFLPIISSATQARHEGYFRIEWDLAAERSHGIAQGVPFILPVVIDDFREPEALVPDRFRKVQWTQLPGGTVSPDVLARLLKLWSHRTGALSHEEQRNVQAAHTLEGTTTTRSTAATSGRSCCATVRRRACT